MFLKRCINCCTSDAESVNWLTAPTGWLFNTNRPSEVSPQSSHNQTFLIALKCVVRLLIATFLLVRGFTFDNKTQNPPSW